MYEAIATFMVITIVLVYIVDEKLKLGIIERI